ncbi:MAG: GNAT family N-acetyltransferase [Candidatus Sulfotelmatobacter sp.]
MSECTPISKCVATWVGKRGLWRRRSIVSGEYLGRPTETYGLWATILKTEKKYIGCCGLRAAGSEAYLGYFLARPYWGRGLASEAAKAFIDVAFDGLRLPRLLADVEQGHEVSEHILRKFGFSFLSREEIAGSGRVILDYELSRAEWERRSIQPGHRGFSG